MTIATGAALIAAARARGQRVWAETCPQYLVLDTSALDRRGPYAKCSPPIRSRANVEQLWPFVLHGTIDTIGSDHAPFPAAQKDPGFTDIWEAHNGLVGIQTMVPLILSEGVHRRGMSLPRAAALLSTNAARIFDLYPRKGVIQVGADADLMLVDLQREWTVDGAQFLSRNRWSPYDGMRLTGQIQRTIVRGRTVYTGAGIQVQPGYGEQVLPQRTRATAALATHGPAQ
jgi:dihydroorotase-like cyclic amidohydrolase